MVPETNDDKIPKRLVVADEKSFPQGNENLIHNQPAALEIRKLEVLSRSK
jgi:hypothetical protein